MEVPTAKSPQSDQRKSRKVFNGAQISVRILAIATSLTSTCLMVTNKQSVALFGGQIDARYTYSPAFMFFAVANAIACGISSISLLFAVVLLRAGWEPFTYFMLLANDLVMMCLVLAGCSAATAIGYVGMYGNNHTGWAAICDSFHKFCRTGTVSVAFSYISFLSFLALVLTTAYKARKC